jgi:hypothetical protein
MTNQRRDDSRRVQNDIFVTIQGENGITYRTDDACRFTCRRHGRQGRMPIRASPPYGGTGSIDKTIDDL